MPVDDETFQRLRDLILANVVSAEKAKRVVEYLFRMIGRQDRISAQDISDNGGPKGDVNVCPYMSRLRDQIAGFFDYHPIGRSECCRVVLPNDDRGNSCRSRRLFP